MDEKYKYKWWALIGISLLAFTAFLDFTIVNTAFPFIQKDLHADVLQLQWVANIFPIILSMTMLAVGKWADRWGRKRVFYIGITFFAIGAFFAGFSQSIQALVVFRGFQALGASVLFVAAAALLSDAFPKAEYPKAASVFGGITGFGLVIGPFIGGLLIAWLSWRWVFWVNIPLIAVGLCCSFFSLKRVNPEKHSARINWRSFFLLLFGLGLFINGIVAFSWVLVLLGAIGLTLLLVLDARASNPLLDLKIFKNKIIFLSLINAAMAGMVCFVFMFFDPLYLENVRHLSAQSIGFFIALIPLAQVLVSLGFAFLLRKFGLGNLFAISIASGAIAFCLHRFIGASTPFAFLVLPFLLLGLPWGLGNTGLITAINQELPPQKIGESIGTVTTMWNLWGSIALALSSVAFQKAGPEFIAAFHATTDLNLLFTALFLVATGWALVQLRKGCSR